MLAWLESLRSKAFATRATPDKPASGSCIIKENMSNKELAEELHKPIIRKFKKRKLHSPFIDKILIADLDDMQLIVKFNKRIYFLLGVIHILSRYAWLIHLKDKKGTTITKAFQKMFDESNRKASNKWVDKGSEFYNRSRKFLLNNSVEMDSKHNNEKSAVISTLKDKVYNHMTLMSKNVYIDKLDNIVNKCIS